MKRTDITELFPEATPEQIQKIMDLNGADINAAKSGVEELKTQLASAKSSLAAAQSGVKPDELQAALDRAAAAEAELAGLKAQNTLRELRRTVAAEMKVPEGLLTADTEEACRAQAQAILDFAQPGSYPTLRDAGEVTKGANTKGARDAFADWAKDNL